MKIGIDFGTTHTTAAVYDGGKLEMIPLDPLNSDPLLLRSMIYVTRNHEVFLGMKGVQNFLKHDTGRPVVMQERVVGTIETTVARAGRGPLDPDGPITIIYDALIDEDVGMRGRLLQSIKTGMRSASYDGTKIFGQYFTVQELVALLLKYVHVKVEEFVGQKVTEATFGRPVFFAENLKEDQIAEARLAEAAKMAGFDTVSFVQEPVAAAHFYLSKTDQPERVLVFDFGGGTLDFTIINTDGKNTNIEILATHGVDVGGDNFDKAIMKHTIAPHLGVDSYIDIDYDDRKIPFPRPSAALLEQWTTIPMLSRPKQLKIIEDAIKYGQSPDKFRALYNVVTKNYGFMLFEEIEQAKIRLSDSEETFVQMQVEQVELDAQLTQRTFNRNINLEFVQVRKGLAEVVQLAGLRADEIDTIVTTGGSSRIPLFRQLLMDEFSDAKLVHSDTFGSVAAGLAVFAAGEGS